jgi:hypothetical protein
MKGTDLGAVEGMLKDDRSDEQKERAKIVASGEKVRRRSLKLLWKLRRESENHAS